MPSSDSCVELEVGNLAIFPLSKSVNIAAAKTVVSIANGQIDEAPAEAARNSCSNASMSDTLRRRKYQAVPDLPPKSVHSSIR
jgi:hypothetical protein